MFKCQGDT